MKFLKVFWIFLLSLNVYGVDKTIYGDDDRLEPFQYTNSEFSYLANSVAGQISKKNLKKNSSGFKISSKVKTLKKTHKLCADQNFVNQPVAASCTAFLVAPNVLLTAGHCFGAKYKKVCKNNYWVFDYKVNEDMGLGIIPAKNVYKCKKVVVSEGFGGSSFGSLNGPKIDWAIVELDRPVEGRNPLIINRNGPAAIGTNLIMMGHPFGLPLKISPKGRVFDIEGSALVTSLDSFRGNSGSPVFNADTGDVEGILVRGKMTFSSSRGCKRVNVCDENGQNCTSKDRLKIKGEEVLMIKEVLPELDKIL